MSVNYTTDAELAEAMSITVERLHVLRVRRGWPCVKFGRNVVRFTDDQIAEINSIQTEQSGTNRTRPSTALAGQTGRSAARRRTA